MRIIIVGASGTIGTALWAAAKRGQHKVMATCHRRQKPGLLSFDLISQSITSLIPDLSAGDVVYLLSAYTNVSWIFANQKQAQQLNVDATKQLIDEVAPTGARIIFMSSVEVFDGQQGGYDEQAKPHPLSVYGHMKYAIETYLIQKQVPSCIVRTGWNVAWDMESPCVVKATYQSLLQDGAKMAQDNVFSISDVNDTVEGLLRLSQHPQINCCHLVSQPAVIRSQLAAMILEMSRHKGLMPFKTVAFAAISYPEPRARETHLDNSLALKALGMKFRDSKEIIRQKIEYLDQNYALL